MSERPEPKSTHRYFEEEREYLRHVGREFAAAHPGAARFLHGEGDDPSVERLLQGVAFLTARIRHRLDQELPELSHELFRLLWPNFLRPVPPMTMQRFEAPDTVGWTHRIPRGARVRSAASTMLGASRGGRCTFRTLYDVELPPASVTDLSCTPTRGGERLRITFQLNRGLDLEDLPSDELSSLRLYLAGPTDAVARELLYFMLQHTPKGGLRLRNPDTPEASSLPLPAPQRVGFAPHEALLPGWETTPEPYRLLQEYYAFPQKFQFIDITGLSPMTRLGKGGRFELEFNFAREFPHRARLRPEHVLLGCTPAVNLFASSAAFRRRTPAILEEYPLRPRGARRGEEEVFSVDELSGVPERSNQRHIYRPLLERAMELQGIGVGSRWYQERVEVDPDRKHTQTYLRLSLPDEPDKDETFSVKLTCTNGQLPMECAAGEIDDASGLPAGVLTRNLSAPTPPIPPPLSRELEWRALTHLSVARSTLADVKGLRRLLTLYNHAAHARSEVLQVHRRRMAALRAVSVAQSQELVPWTAAGGQGSAAWSRGAEVEVVMDIARFGGVGEAFLFGAVLDEVLGHWVTLNAFSRLSLRDHDHGSERIRFPARLGERALL